MIMPSRLSVLTLSRRLSSSSSSFLRVHPVTRGVIVRNANALSSLSSYSVRCLSIGRMLDLGGMPSASNDSKFIRPVGYSKNSKLQAIAFDFGLLTRSLADSSQDEVVSETAVDDSAPSNNNNGLELKVDAQPDLDKIQQIASLLKVSVSIPEPDAITTSNQSIKLKGFGDNTAVNKKLLRTGPLEDVRSKYARKLKGGLAGIELAKSELQDAMTRGDAKGLVSARKIVQATSAASEQQVQQGGSGATRWMAMSGTGKLLAYLTNRAIKIALLPDPTWAGSTALHTPMHDFTKQLPEVVIDAVLEVSSSAPYRAGTDDTNTTTAALAKQLIRDLDVEPSSILVVSDRDDYLRAARDLGMMTCRLQRPNSRRGNVTALYTSESIPEVQEVVNEINGISFSTVLNR